jgi:hypothetical protein
VSAFNVPSINRVEAVAGGKLGDLKAGSIKLLETPKRQSLYNRKRSALQSRKNQQEVNLMLDLRRK